MKGGPKSSLAPRFVADDNGYADHKLAWFDQAGKIQVMKVPSMVSSGSVNSLTDPQGKAVGAYEWEGTRFTCNANLRDPISIRNSDYPTSVANRILVAHALTNAKLNGIDVRLAVTLPLRDYYKPDGSANDLLKAATIKNFLPVEDRSVTVVDSDQHPQIISVNAYCEALCGYFDWALNEKGGMREEAKDLQGEIAIVDIGGSTTDIIALRLENGGLVINNAASGTAKLGVLDAKDSLGQRMQKKMAEASNSFAGHDQGLGAWFVNLALEKGVAKLGPKEWDFKDDRKAACGEVASKINSFIGSKLGSVWNYQLILIIGGGAIVFQEWLKEQLPSAEFSDEFANARGALKYMKTWGGYGDQ